MTSKKHKALGRGLSAIIPNFESEEAIENLYEIPLSHITVNPFQPRKLFDDTGMEELVNSIREKGIIQPITVRKKDDEYQLIAGERRVRAARIVGLETIPAYVTDVASDEEMMELSLIENIQREDLNPVDEAIAYSLLIEKYGISQEKVATNVGKSRTTITNSIRLLKLPEEILNGLRNRKITTGHARALLGLESTKQQITLYHKIVHEGLSVRTVEEWVRKLVDREPRPKTTPQSPFKNPYYFKIESKLQQTLGTKVRIKPSARGGKLEIEYYSLEDLERLMELFDSIDY
ncbi:MAG: ParB/RepB/Spo0J family partition protein [Candidatus Marinimicrobia bacterium]|jgi:ParB family chromosome partitioning protein|nr:ParB/RepB/Spo0J family partition protein [Candidatus Neomarinimicrobiota bacterium]